MQQHVSDSPTQPAEPTDVQQLLDSVTPMLAMPSTFPSYASGDKPANPVHPSPVASEDGYTTADPEDLFLNLSNLVPDPPHPSEKTAEPALALPSVSEAPAPAHGLPPHPPQFNLNFPPPVPNMSFNPTAPPFPDPAAFWAAPAPVPVPQGVGSSAGSDSTPPTHAVPQGEKRRRRLREASELLPVDAPVQKRRYYGTSQTSRRDYIGSGETPAPPPESAGAGDVTPDVAVAALLAKRHKNTISARQSRRRKAEELSQLKDDNARLTRANEAMAAELAQVRAQLAAFQSRFAMLFPSP